MRSFLVSAILLVGWSAGAATGLRWEASQKAGGDQESVISRMVFDRSSLRLERVPKSGAVSHAIVLRQGKTASQLDLGTKTYQTIDLEQAKKVMEAQKEGLKKLPPDKGQWTNEPRGVLQALQFSDIVRQLLAQPLAKKPLGKKKTIGKWQCEVFEVVSAQDRSELCVADVKSFGTSLDDFRALESLSKSLAAHPRLGAMGVGIAKMWTEVRDLGVTVESKTFDPSGKISFESTLVALEKQPVPAETFEAPKGFTKR